MILCNVVSSNCQSLQFLLTFLYDHNSHERPLPRGVRPSTREDTPNCFIIDKGVLRFLLFISRVSISGGIKFASGFNRQLWGNNCVAFTVLKPKLLAHPAARTALQILRELGEELAVNFAARKAVVPPPITPLDAEAIMSPSEVKYLKTCISDI